MTMITPSYLGETIEYSSLHACRSTLEDPTYVGHKSDVCSDEDAERCEEPSFERAVANCQLQVA